MAISAPYLPYQKIAELAAAFIANHNPENVLPLPIEEIVEFNFGIDIIAMPGFHVNYEVDAFISSDLSEIRVDQSVYDAKNKNRYRFSLAHELAHAVLHQDIFKQLKYSSVAAWKASRDAIPEKAYSWLEWQANCFAGLILVPPLALASKFELAVAHAESVGIDIYDARPEAWDNIERWLGAEFGVSTAVISRRAVKDGLWEAGEM